MSSKRTSYIDLVGNEAGGDRKLPNALRMPGRNYIAFAAAPICAYDRGPQLVVMRSP
jgi:hypothetical protein